MYFDFKTINELINNKHNYDREEKEFTMEELGQYSGENGMPAYVAIEGFVYDVSKIPAWETGKHFGLTAGQDLSEEFANCHGIIDILTNAPKVGVLAENEYMNNDEYMNNGINMAMNRLIRQQDTSKFTPDDWIRYTVPLVVYALREPTQGMNIQRTYQKIILMGVLVGLGKTPQQAITQVQEWQNSGTAKLLQGGATAPGVGTGTGGTAGGTTGTGVGTGTGAGGTTGTSGGFGTGGAGGGTTGTGGGFGTGGTAGGTTGTSGGFGTGGTAGGTTGTGVGTGTGGTAGGTTGTGVGTGTGGTAGGTTGTSGGFGTGGTAGGTTGTSGGFGTGGTTSGTTGTGVGTGTGGTTVRNRLNID